MRLFKRALPLEEWYNVTTHFAGLIFSLIAIPFLIILSSQGQTAGQIVGVIFFCFGLLFMYASSTAYHWAIKDSIKNALKILDHISIFMLIGGSYTAFILTYLNTKQGWIFLAIQWTIISFGILFKIFYTGKYEWLSLLLYLVLGWMVVFIFEEVTLHMSSLTLWLMIVGGASYTIGTIFYAVKKIPFGHAIWHLFVIGGTATHYFSLYSGIAESYSSI